MRRELALNNPKIQISWGELFDKITILELKLENLESESALRNVRTEYESLYSIYTKAFRDDTVANKLLADLKEINQQLWATEDKIRIKEKEKSFDNEFIELARSVYIQNDLRSNIKRKINILFRSELTEEKSYAGY
jgi:hypothetical protein